MKFLKKKRRSKLGIFFKVYTYFILREIARFNCYITSFDLSLSPTLRFIAYYGIFPTFESELHVKEWGILFKIQIIFFFEEKYPF